MGGPSDMDLILRHVERLRQAVNAVLSTPLEQSLMMNVSAEDTEDGARWIVNKCRAWDTAVARSLGRLGEQSRFSSPKDGGDHSSSRVKRSGSRGGIAAALIANAKSGPAAE